ncbi:uncharacterized protein TNCV_3994131 [Trichonephila clavipes]|uniref:Uncharacterized protein n=1 Tax=Trichonephila clavipes TaxID=2585209 RepID=A0A8X6VST0_TRICX|nr:uncharacterized protein TNCV_3994131 [Trichonephila clavipes]
MVSDGTEFSVGDIEKLFDETRRKTKAKHENWAKYYDRRMGNIQINVNDYVLVKTHPLSSAAEKVVTKFKPKFECPYRVLEKVYNGDQMSRSIAGRMGQAKGHKVDKRALTLNNSNNLPHFKNRFRTQETMIPSTSGYNLQPRESAKVESGPANEKRAQQGVPVQSRTSRQKP